MTNRNAAVQPSKFWPNDDAPPPGALHDQDELSRLDSEDSERWMYAPQILMDAMARVVVIDDDPEIIRVINDLLQAHAYDSPHAYSSSTLDLNQVRRHMPDVVLCDLDFPGLTGWEIGQQMQVDRRIGTLRLVAITSSAYGNPGLSARAAGFDGHICKPIDAETFIGDLEQFLPTYLRLGAAALARSSSFHKENVGRQASHH